MSTEKQDSGSELIDEDGREKLRHTLEDAIDYADDGWNSEAKRKLRELQGMCDAILTEDSDGDE